jgi:hypothetical protein
MSQSNVIDLQKLFETRSPSSGSQSGKFLQFKGMHRAPARLYSNRQSGFSLSHYQGGKGGRFS